jgi:UDP-glucose 4-epimerase
VISATTPFAPADRAALRTDAAAVVARYVPRFAEIYLRRGWSMFPDIGRVYDNSRARSALGWRPRYDFARLVELLGRGADFRSPLAQAIGSKGYHAESFENGPYPVD